jgi:hypothetical protein
LCGSLLISSAKLPLVLLSALFMASCRLIQCTSSSSYFDRRPSCLCRLKWIVSNYYSPLRLVIGEATGLFPAKCWECIFLNARILYRKSGLQSSQALLEMSTLPRGLWKEGCMAFHYHLPFCWSQSGHGTVLFVHYLADFGASFGQCSVAKERSLWLLRYKFHIMLICRTVDIVRIASHLSRN